MNNVVFYFSFANASSPTFGSLASQSTGFGGSPGFGSPPSFGAPAPAFGSPAPAFGGKFVWCQNRDWLVLLLSPY